MVIDHVRYAAGEAEMLDSVVGRWPGETQSQFDGVAVARA